MGEVESDIEIDNLLSEGVESYLKNEREMFMRELYVDKEDLQNRINHSITGFLESRNDYVIIGGKALQRYINNNALTKIERDVMETFDWDIMVFNDVERFAEEMGTFLEQQFRNAKNVVKFSARELPNSGIIQIGYELRRTTTYFADIHNSKKSIQATKINGIRYANIEWILEELVRTMFTESEVKSYKRFTRKEILETALSGKLELFDQEYLKEVCKDCTKEELHNYFKSKKRAQR